jgi:hypothetical protein
MLTICRWFDNVMESDQIILEKFVESTNFLLADYRIKESHVQGSITNVYNPTKSTFNIPFLDSLKFLGELVQEH